MFNINIKKQNIKSINSSRTYNIYNVICTVYTYLCSRRSSRVYGNRNSWVNSASACAYRRINCIKTHKTRSSSSSDNKHKYVICEHNNYNIITYRRLYNIRRNRKWEIRFRLLHFSFSRHNISLVYYNTI